MKSIYFSTCILLILTITGCKKQFLDAKPDKAIVIPESLTDLRGLLDNEVFVMNMDVGFGQIASDDVFIAEDMLPSITLAAERNSYFWADDIYEGGTAADWDIPYSQIFYSNVVLETIGNIDRTDKNKLEWNEVKGAALFYRANAFFNLAETFCMPYSSNAANDLGVPMSLVPDVQASLIRGKLNDLYSQILTDLSDASALLPLKTAKATRPSLPACYALLARVYLSMGDYVKAGYYADACLQEHDVLLDFNELPTDANFTIPEFNEETIFYSRFINYRLMFTFINTMQVNPDLYESFADTDLRKRVNYIERANGLVNFKGSYSQLRLFSGIATDEVLLTRAECRARTGDVNGALADLNRLCVNRYDKYEFNPYTTEEISSLLDAILMERRKELAFRGSRWRDLRRLNKDDGYAVSIERKLFGETFVLAPNSLKYTFPIPDNEISRSGIEQNPR